MQALYKYNMAIDDILASADEDGVIPDDAAELLDALMMEREQKIDNCIAYYKSRQAMADALKAEKKSISERQAKAQKDADWMKEYLARCLDGEKWESTAGKVSYRRSKSVELSVPAEELPDEYLKWTAAPDKKAISAVLKGGGTIDGCKLVENISTTIK